MAWVVCNVIPACMPLDLLNQSSFYTVLLSAYNVYVLLVNLLVLFSFLCAFFAGNTGYHYNSSSKGTLPTSEGCQTIMGDFQT